VNGEGEGVYVRLLGMGGDGEKETALGKEGMRGGG
jgi:hypothetical protein